MKTPTAVSRVAPERSIQRFIDLGRLSATLLHEISNPLSAALLHLEQINDQHSLGVRQTRRSLNRLKKYVDIARRQLRDQAALTSFCLNPQIQAIKRLVLPAARAAGVHLTVDAAPHYKLQGDPIKFQQVFTNLIINAIEAYNDDLYPELVKPVHFSIASKRNKLCLTVTDWGEGIAPSKLPKLFEPFYTTKGKTGHGLGIGLFVVKQYVNGNFGGQIKVISNSRVGTRFIVTIPAQPYPIGHLKR